MKKLFIIAAVLVGLFLASLALGLFGGGKEQVSNEAIPFNFPDYSGSQVSLADVSDKEVVVLNFWASWCPFCVAEMPDFAQLQEEFPKEVAVVAVNRAESLETAKEFSDSVGVTDRLILLLDKDDSLYRAYGAFAMPTTYFIKDGFVVDQKFGPMDFEEMWEKVQKLLAQEAA